jgi:hypothetical protein
VRFDHVARVILNASHGMTRMAEQLKMVRATQRKQALKKSN